jgi:hypothetical protein
MHVQIFVWTYRFNEARNIETDVLCYRMSQTTKFENVSRTTTWDFTLALFDGQA